jgi:hypothetical protein
MTVRDQKSDQLYMFGPFELDPVRRLLRRSGEAVPLNED